MKKNSSPGGLLRSFQQDGFTFDFTGHLLHINHPSFRQFINKTVGFEHLNLLQRKSAIFSHNTQTPYPFQMNLHGLPPQTIYECLEGFINRKKSLKRPASFYNWVLKYFGTGLGKHFFFPYNSKILSYDVKKIHPSWTGRFVPQTTLKAMLMGTLIKNPEHSVGYNSTFYYPKSGGIETIIKKLVTQLKTPITTNHEATGVDLQNKTIHFHNGHTEKFKYLITTLPLNELLNNVKSESRTALKNASHKLLCTSVVNFNVGFDVENISDKHWLYFPEKQYPFYRIGFWNNIAPTSVRNGCSAIYGETSYLGGTKTDNQRYNLLNVSIKKALPLLSLDESNIVTKKILHLKHAYVIYDLWREKNLKKLHGRLHECNIHSVGRFGEWKYASMEEAISDGEHVANTILSNLTIKKNSTIIPATKYNQNKITPTLNREKNRANTR